MSTWTNERYTDPQLFTWSWAAKSVDDWTGVPDLLRNTVISACKFSSSNSSKVFPAMFHRERFALYLGILIKNKMYQYFSCQWCFNNTSVCIRSHTTRQNCKIIYVLRGTALGLQTVNRLLQLIQLLFQFILAVPKIHKLLFQLIFLHC